MVSDNNKDAWFVAQNTKRNWHSIVSISYTVTHTLLQTTLIDTDVTHIRLSDEKDGNTQEINLLPGVQTHQKKKNHLQFKAY